MDGEYGLRSLKRTPNRILTASYTIRPKESYEQWQNLLNAHDSDSKSNFSYDHGSEEHAS